MLLAAVVATAAIWVTTAWLLAVANKADTATDRAKVRIDAVRTGLAAGAGAGITLMLAFRRQSHQEFDTAERRITELYNAAVRPDRDDDAEGKVGEFLGSDGGSPSTLIRLPRQPCG